MPNKNLDGIKRISGQELERARKIILESIGEKDSRFEKKDSFKPVPKRGKALDGLSAAGPAVSMKKLVKEMEEKNSLLKSDFIFQNSRPLKTVPNFPAKKSGVFKVEKIMEQEAKLAAEKGKAELKEKKDREAAEFALEEKNRKKAEEAKVVAEQEAKMVAEKKKRDLREKKNKEAAKLALEEKNRKKREEIKRAQKIKKEIKREIRIIRWEKFKNQVRGNWRGSVKIFIFSALFLGIAAILFYLIFCLLLLRFNIDSKITRQLSEYTPVPAVIAREGWIEYYDYLRVTADLEKQYESQSELQRARRNRIINKIVLDELVKRYNLNLKNKADEEILEEINFSLAADKEKNEISISRMEKIKELVTQSNETMAAGGQSESFEVIGKKYSDEQGYLTNGQENSKFSNFLGGLAVGEVSEVLIADDGYYIFEKDEGGFKYIFIKSITFSKYLENSAQEMKIWILAK